MAEFETIRPINLPQSQEVYDNDVFVIDSETGGVRKIPKDKVMTEIDDTLTQTGQAADAKKVGDELDTINDTLDENIPLIQNPTKTVSGSIAHFTDGAEMPAQSVIVNIEPQQSGTGTPSPDNVRPISGWESVVLGQSGENLIDAVNLSPTSSARWINTDGVAVKSNVQYALSVTASKSLSNRFYVIYADKATITQSETTSGKTFLTAQFVDSNTLTFTFTASNDAYIYLYAGDVVGDFTLSEVQIELGSTATAYEPYTGTTTTVNLGRTVYGGTLDVVSGVLTVTHGYQLFNENTMCYNVSVNFSSGYNRALYNTLVATAKRDQETPITSDIFSYTNVSILGLYKGNINNNGILCLGVPDTITTTAEMQTWAGQNPFVIVYELATPQTYQLTPTEVSTLLGENNVWADSGDVEITYRRDISIVINNLESALNG